MTYFKAIRPDGASFYDPMFRWLPEGHQPGDPIPEGWIVTHPDPAPEDGLHATDADRYLSVATVPTECVGFSWPCRLLAVEPVGHVVADDYFLHKRRVLGVRIITELPAHETLGPQGAAVAAIIERARRLTREEIALLAARTDTSAARTDTSAARNSAWDAAQNSVRTSAWAAAGSAAENALRDVARNPAWGRRGDPAWGRQGDAAATAVKDAAQATLVRDLVSTRHYNALMKPWRVIEP